MSVISAVLAAGEGVVGATGFGKADFVFLIKVAIYEAQPF